MSFINTLAHKSIYVIDFFLDPTKTQKKVKMALSICIFIFAFSWTGIMNINKVHHLTRPHLEQGCQKSRMHVSSFETELCIKKQSKNFINGLSYIAREVSAQAPIVIGLATLNPLYLNNYAASVFANHFTVTSLKELCYKRRPDGSNGQSFPSGHAAQSALAAAFITANNGILLGAPFIILAGLNSLSRIYTDSHFPIDVVAGLLIGTIYGLFTYKVGNFVLAFIRRRLESLTK